MLEEKLSELIKSIDKLNLNLERICSASSLSISHVIDSPVKEEPGIEVTTYNIQQANDIIMPLVKKVGMDKILSIFKEYGATRLSQIDPTKYSEIIEKVKKLCN